MKIDNLTMLSATVDRLAVLKAHTTTGAPYPVVRLSARKGV